MSIRVLHAILPVALSLILIVPARSVAEEAVEGETDIKSMVQKVMKQIDAQKEKASGEAPFPFGHYLSSAPAPVKVSNKTEEKRPSGPVGLPEFAITGKMKMGRQVKLFIGRGAYGIGDSVEGAKLIEIKDDEAVFEYSGSRYTRSIP